MTSPLGFRNVNPEKWTKIGEWWCKPEMRWSGNGEKLQCDRISSPRMKRRVLPRLSEPGSASYQIGHTMTQHNRTAPATAPLARGRTMHPLLPKAAAYSFGNAGNRAIGQSGASGNRALDRRQSLRLPWGRTTPFLRLPRRCPQGVSSAPGLVSTGVERRLSFCGSPFRLILLSGTGPRPPRQRRYCMK